MQHLTLEAIARLVDEPPLAGEAAHLSGCLVCRRELDEMRGQTAALGALDEPELPAHAWVGVEAALRAEGLLLDIPRRAPVPVWRRPELLRAAAALALFVAGGALGVLYRGRHGAEQVAVAPETVRGLPITVRPPAGMPDAAPSAARPVASAEEGPFEVETVPAPAGGARLASTGGAPRPPRAQTPEVRRAARELARAEAAYLVALQRYAAIADPQSGADPQTRMDALERMLSTTREALDQAPDDPVINGYHMAALHERDQLRRDMAANEKDWF
jgi:hypothetical protein